MLARRCGSEPHLHRGRSLRLLLDGQRRNVNDDESASRVSPKCSGGTHTLQGVVTIRRGAELMRRRAEPSTVQQTSVQNPNSAIAAAAVSRADRRAAGLTPAASRAGARAATSGSDRLLRRGSICWRPRRARRRAARDLSAIPAAENLFGCQRAAASSGVALARHRASTRRQLLALCQRAFAHRAHAAARAHSCASRDRECMLDVPRGAARQHEHALRRSSCATSTSSCKIAREERLVAQQQANRELIRNLAHEIKNPLGGIRGAAQLLERELDRPRAARVHAGDHRARPTACRRSSTAC